jgi:hypothetical protein
MLLPYDGSGEFAYRVGLPGKSGVGRRKRPATSGRSRRPLSRQMARLLLKRWRGCPGKISSLMRRATRLPGCATGKFPATPGAEPAHVRPQAFFHGYRVGDVVIAKSERVVVAGLALFGSALGERRRGRQKRERDRDPNQFAHNGLPLFHRAAAHRCDMTP